MRGMKKVVVVAVALVLGMFFLNGAALAVDAPKWVAVLYIEAQKAVGLRWIPPAGATGYKVLRSETEGSGHQEIAATTAPQHFDKAVEPGTTYYYVLQAVAGGETSANSEEKKVTIPGVKKALNPPQWEEVTAQSSTQMGKINYRVGLSWKAMDGAIAYNIYRSTVQGKDYQLLSSTSERQYSDVAVLDEDKTFYYVLSALDQNFSETGFSEEKAVEIKKEVQEQKKKRIQLKVVPRKARLLWTVAQGDQGGKVAFNEPYDVEVDEDQNLVYANSKNTQNIYVFNADTGALVRTVGKKGRKPGEFMYPMGMDLDMDGNLYAADYSKGTIQIYNNKGAFQREFKLVPPDGVVLERDPSPLDVVVDDETGDIYIVESNNHKIWVLDEDGEFLRFLGETGIEEGQIMTPLYMRMDQEGKLVIINGNKTRIDTYEKEDGTHLHSFGLRKPGVGSFVFISGFAFDTDGNILVLDKSVSNLQGFLRDGRYIFHMSDEKGEGGAPLFTPKGLAVDSKNRVFISEGLSNRIQAFQILDPPPEPQYELEE